MSLLEQCVVREDYFFYLVGVLCIMNLTRYSLSFPVLQIVLEPSKLNLPHFNNFLLGVDGTGFVAQTLGATFHLTSPT